MVAKSRIPGTSMRATPSIAQFIVTGTNHGPLGSMPATDRKMTMPFCEIAHFDKQDRIVSGGCYYDQYTLLTQLGHIQPLAVVA